MIGIKQFVFRWAATTIAVMVASSVIHGIRYDTVAALIGASRTEQLAENLRVQGVVVDAGELRQLPHDVELSDRLRARLGQSPGPV